MAISLSPASRGELRNALRLLKLLFRYGNNKEVASQFQQGYTTGSVDTWLQVHIEKLKEIHRSIGDSSNYRPYGFSKTYGKAFDLRLARGSW